jgi:N-formylglutamate deformylase
MTESSPPIPGTLAGEVVARHDPEAAPCPVILDSPHSGRAWPPDFVPSASPHRVRRLEDAYVDELFGSAPRHGATLIRALFPRCYIDPNRAPDDLDETMLDAPWPGSARPGPKTELGIGLIASRDAHGPVYDRKLTVAEVRRRLEGYYWPYHRVLRSALDEAHGRAGAVWHLNCHSMKAVSGRRSREDPAAARLDVCLGDRDGTTCEPGFTRLVAGTFEDLGYRVSVNRPYKGVELVRRYSGPRDGRHSLQIELNRSLYMDEDRLERHQGFARLARDLARVVAVVCDHARRHTRAGRWWVGRPRPAAPRVEQEDHG